MTNKNDQEPPRSKPSRPFFLAVTVTLLIIAGLLVVDEDVIGL